MNDMRAPFARRTVTVSIIAAFLFCTPLHLIAQEREPRATEQASVIASLSGLWSNLTAWLAGEMAPPQPELPAANRDNGCSVDPHGGDCGG